MRTPAARRRRRGRRTDPVEVTVDLIIDRAANDGFRLVSNLIQNGRLTFRNNHHDGFIVNFRIRDDVGIGRNYFFPTDEEDAMWVRKVTGTGDCPNNSGHWGQFKATGVDEARKILTVRNKNGHMQYFGFALRVGPARGNPTLCFDPIGDNQNGQAN